MGHSHHPISAALIYQFVAHMVTQVTFTAQFQYFALNTRFNLAKVNTLPLPVHIDPDFNLNYSNQSTTQYAQLCLVLLLIQHKWNPIITSSHLPMILSAIN